MDAKLLEMLWCPCGSSCDPKWLSKDVVRAELASLSAKDGKVKSVNEQLWAGSCNWQYDENECPQCHAGGLLARVLLGPMDFLFECERNRGHSSPLLWVIAKLYDQIGGVNSYRTLSSLNRSATNYRIGQLLFRVPEANYQWFKDHVADFSTLLRGAEDKTEVDYCLVLDKKLQDAAGKKEKELRFHIYDIFSIMDILDRIKDIRGLRRDLAKCTSADVSRQLSLQILSPDTLGYREDAFRQRKNDDQSIPLHLRRQEPALLGLGKAPKTVEKAIKDAQTALDQHFYPVPQSDVTAQHLRPLPQALQTALKDLVKKVNKQADIKIKLDDVFLRKLANYFIWLGALHPNLGSYTVRYAASYRLMPVGNADAESKHDRIQNPCFVIASRKLPSSRLLAAARVSLTHCLGPLEDYYAIKQATQAGEQSEFKRWRDVLGHEQTVLLTHFEGQEVPKNPQAAQWWMAKAKQVMAYMNLWTGGREAHYLKLWDGAGPQNEFVECYTTVWRKFLIRLCCDSLRTFAMEKKFRRMFDSVMDAGEKRIDSQVSLESGIQIEPRDSASERMNINSWVTVIVMTLIGNALKHAALFDGMTLAPSLRELYDARRVFDGVPKVCLHRDTHRATLLVSVTNRCKEKRKDFDKASKLYAIRGNGEKPGGTFRVLSILGPLLYEACHLEESYEWSRFCHAPIFSDNELTLTVSIPVTYKKEA